MSPLREVARNAVVMSGEAQAVEPDARTRLFAGDRAVR
jgi:hypothetical protein